MQPRVFISDGQRESALDKSIRDVLEREGLLVPSVSGKERIVSFCGFVVDSSAILVSLPKTLELPDEDDLDICRLLYRTFLRFLREEAPESEGSSTDDPIDNEDRTTLSVFQVYNDLLDDWARYGIYRNRIEEERKGLSGRPNWKKTMKKVVPFLDRRGVPIYPYFHTERRDLKLEGLVSEIHRWCVANADHAIGWLKSSGSSTLLFPAIAHACAKAPCDKQTAVRVLTGELRKCYGQRKIHLLKLMIKLLLQTDSGIRIEHRRYGVRHFWPVWEAICKARLEDQSEEHGSALPQPSYRRKDGARYNGSSKIGQRPDVVIGFKGATLAVVDAKYYDVRRGVPGWKDIVKQLFYAASYKKTGYAASVRNVLMFPKPDGVKLPNKIVMDVPDDVQTVADFDEARFLQMFPPIECIYVSMLEAMKSYSCRERDDLRECLLEEDSDIGAAADA